MRRLLLAALALAAPAGAQTVGAAVRGGTLGLGLDVATPVTERVDVRVAARGLAFGRSTLLDASDLGVEGLTLDVDTEVGLGSVGLLADWYPFGTTFRVTGGALVHVNEAAAVVRAAGPYYSADLDRTFSVERVGTLRAEVSYERPVAPYLGLGVGDRTAGRFGLTVDVGAAYVGPPSVEMTGTGLIGGTADPANVATLEAGLDSFRLHPVVSVGLKTSLGL